MTRRPPIRTLSTAALILALLLASGPAAAQQQQEEATVTAVDQDSNGLTVVASSTDLPQGGFLIVHDDRLLEGDVKGSIVGESQYLEPGTHQNVTLVMDESTQGVSTLFIMAHQDTDGDTQYTFDISDEDGPYTTAAGDPVMVEINATFQEGMTNTETGTTGTETQTETETETGTGFPTETDTETGGLTDDRTPRQGDDPIGDGEGDQQRDEDTPGLGLGLTIAMLAGLALVVARRR